MYIAHFYPGIKSKNSYICPQKPYKQIRRVGKLGKNRTIRITVILKLPRIL